MRKKKRFSLVCLILAASFVAVFSSKSFGIHGMYDGTYEPNDTSPPLNQSTWDMTVVPNATFSWNYPTAGIAECNDSSSVGSIAFHRDVSDDFGSDPNNVYWTIETKFAWSDAYDLGQTSGPSPTMYFGMTDEGGNGKSVVVAYFKGTDNVYRIRAGSIDAQGRFSVITALLDESPRDNRYHTWKIEKRFDADRGMNRVYVYKDGVIVGPTIGMNYHSQFNDDFTSDHGVKWSQYINNYDMTPNYGNFSRIYLDYLFYSIGNPSSCFETIMLGNGSDKDFNEDCVINFKDFAMLAGEWLDCYDPNTINCN